MKDIYTLGRGTNYSAALLLLVALTFSIVLPLNAFAEDATAQTVQILPPTSTTSTCAPVRVSDFTPYVYDGSLHAFEFTVSDSSYVAIGGTVGNQSLPFTYYGRTVEPYGTLRVHADLPTTFVDRDGVPVSVTMLSAGAPGQPVCVSVVSAVVEPEGGLVATPVAATTSEVPATPSTEQPDITPDTSMTDTADDEMPATTEDEEMDTEDTETSAGSPVASAGSTLKDMCSGNGALRLWIALLVVYALIVGGVIWGQPKLPEYLQTQEWAATAIVVPFLALFGFWYFVESCRTSAWIPVIATVIALAGLAAAFWDRNGSNSNVINLPSSKS